MKTGTTGIELELTCAFSADGSDADVTSITIGDRQLPKQLANRLLDWLGAKAQEELVNECWADAEDETDDAGSDEARVA